jgi:hypothetical protein
MLKWVSSQQTISTTNKANNFNRNIVIICGGLAITIGVPIAVYLMHRRRNNRHFRKEETNRRLEDNKVQAESRFAFKICKTLRSIKDLKKTLGQYKTLREPKNLKRINEP